MLTTNKIIQDILRLEKENMTPILNHYGIHFDEKEILKDIKRHNKNLTNLIYIYSRNNELLGYLRFNFDKKKDILVRSIQLDLTSNHPNTMRRLLQLSYDQLFKTNSEFKIYAWVNNQNSKSFNLLEKLNFNFEKGNKDASMFSISKSTLISKLKSLGFK